MVTWQQIGQGEPNPFDVTYTTNSTYGASYGEFVITEGDQVDLPSPQANAAVAVRSFRQTVTITTPSGNIRDSSTTGEVSLNSPRYVILVSDGTNWYVQNNESGISPAIPDNLIDNFEEILYEDKGNTLSDYYSGDLGSFQRQQVTVYEGSYALGGAGSADGIIVNPNTNLEQGKTYSVFLNVANNGATSFAYFVSDVNNYYVVNFSAGNSEIRLGKVEGGGFNIISTTGISSIPFGSWFETQIYVSPSGGHSVTFYDTNGNELDSISMTESTFTSGGHGFNLNNGPNSQFDSVTEV